MIATAADTERLHDISIQPPPTRQSVVLSTAKDACMSTVHINHDVGNLHRTLILFQLQLHVVREDL